MRSIKAVLESFVERFTNAHYTEKDRQEIEESKRKFRNLDLDARQQIQRLWGSKVEGEESAKKHPVWEDRDDDAPVEAPKKPWELPMEGKSPAELRQIRRLKEAHDQAAAKRDQAKMDARRAADREAADAIAKSHETRNGPKLRPQHPYDNNEDRLKSLPSNDLLKRSAEYMKRINPRYQTPLIPKGRGQTSGKGMSPERRALANFVNRYGGLGGYRDLDGNSGLMSEDKVAKRVKDTDDFLFPEGKSRDFLTKRGKKRTIRDLEKLSASGKPSSKGVRK